MLYQIFDPNSHFSASLMVYYHFPSWDKSLKKMPFGAPSPAGHRLPDRVQRPGCDAAPSWGSVPPGKKWNLGIWKGWKLKMYPRKIMKNRAPKDADIAIICYNTIHGNTWFWAFIAHHQFLGVQHKTHQNRWLLNFQLSALFSRRHGQMYDFWLTAALKI